jgi:hypothetical protein
VGSRITRMPSRGRSRTSGPGLLERVVLILMVRFAGELPAMVSCCRRIGKGQSQGIGKTEPNRAGQGRNARRPRQLGLSGAGFDIR